MAVDPIYIQTAITAFIIAVGIEGAILYFTDRHMLTQKLRIAGLMNIPSMIVFLMSTSILFPNTRVPSLEPDMVTPFLFDIAALWSSSVIEAIMIAVLENKSLRSVLFVSFVANSISGIILQIFIFRIV